MFQKCQLTLSYYVLGRVGGRQSLLLTTSSLLYPSPLTTLSPPHIITCSQPLTSTNIPPHTLISSPSHITTNPLLTSPNRQPHTTPYLNLFSPSSPLPATPNPSPHTTPNSPLQHHQPKRLTLAVTVST